MPIIDIHDLDKEEVVFALYENAHQKTREVVSDKDELYLASERLTKAQVAECLRQAQEGRLETVGGIPFQINFSSRTINTDDYDELNEAGYKGVKSSQAVIEGLRAIGYLKQALQVDEVEITYLYGDAYIIKIPSASKEQLTECMEQLQKAGRGLL